MKRFGFSNMYLHTPGCKTQDKLTLIPGVHIGPEITQVVK